MATQQQWGRFSDSQGSRNEPDEYAYPTTHEHRRSLDAHPPRWSRSNRGSIPTSITDTVTETTFGPHSPGTSSLAGTTHGLTPRPPSYQFQGLAAGIHPGIVSAGVSYRNVPPSAGAVEAVPSATSIVSEPLESNFPQQMSHRTVLLPSDQLPNPSTASGYPAAPAAVRSPAVLSHGNQRPPQPANNNNNVSWSSIPNSHFGTPAGLTMDPAMESEGHHDIQRQAKGSIAGRQGVIGSRGILTTPTGTHDLAYGSPRRASVQGPSERRNKFANDLSPLQRLELTLDSMTKEEKRARVQAAEQRARQRAAMRARDASQNQQVEPQTRQGSAGDSPYYSNHNSPVIYPDSVPAAASHQGQFHSQQAPQNFSQQQLQAQGRHRQNTDDHAHFAVSQPVTHISEQHEKQASVLPKRNLSFRERTVQSEKDMQMGQIDTVNPPSAFFTGGPTAGMPVAQTDSKRLDASPIIPHPASNNTNNSGSGISLTRSGSNKLRKEPPANYWNSHRADMDIMHPSAESSKKKPLAQAYAHTDKSGVMFRNKDLPPLPPTATPAQGLQRRATEPSHRPNNGRYETSVAHMFRDNGSISTAHQSNREHVAEPAPGRLGRQDSDLSVGSEPQHRKSSIVLRDPEDLRPGEGLYKPPVWLDEFKKATVGSLSGVLVNLKADQVSGTDHSKAWWENGGQRKKSSFSSKPRKAEAFDGEYDDTNAPTRFKPPLYLKCGPLLRYCGIREEKLPSRTPHASAFAEREIWRGSVMIVTQDSASSYEIAPMLRLFVQDIDLLPSPPHQVDGDLPPEYVDPIAGHPKLGRRGETVYVRPVEHLEEGQDLSRDETDEGLYEKSRSPPDLPLSNGTTELPASFAGRQKRIFTDGEKLQKYKDVRGFRLHAERGCTFWRFNVEVELREKQQRIAYRINRGPCMAFWVPARGQAMNMMFHSCNGFSSSVNSNELSGPDPMWRDVLNTHQSRPFHVMIGGGDQIYNDSVAHKCGLFDEWLNIRNPQHKHSAAFTADMQEEMEIFYLERYCSWFSQGLFGLATSQIPMVNMYDDHDIFDGYGSYPHHYMSSPVFTGLGAVAFKYYMLFQHQSILTETPNTEPSWILGQEPGPYIKEFSRSLFMSMGGKVALLAVDCRTERTEHNVIDDKTWEKIMNRLYAELRRGHVEHLLVLLGVPIAYPRLVWLENILTSRLMDPVKALGRTGMFGKALNNIDGGVEVLDDLNDHWTAKNHKQERSIVIEDLQDLAIDKSVRVTLLSGDVHLAAVGQFYSNPKAGLPKHKDPRYMLNIISSAIVNTPPSDLLADVLNKRNKVHHFDKQTDESMVPLFRHGVDGKSRNNKHLLPHRNWCSIRAWSPGMTPPPTPVPSTHERSPSPLARTNSNHKTPGHGGSLFRRLSLGGGRPSPAVLEGSRTSVRGDRPPVSGGIGGLLRSLSRRNSTDGARPAKLVRTQSLGSNEGKKRGLFGFARRGSISRPDDGGINGQWGDSVDDVHHRGQHHRETFRDTVLRDGASYEHPEYSEDDELHFTARRPHPDESMERKNQSPRGHKADGAADPVIRPFHRTPTGLSVKQMRNEQQYQVDLEGGLDVCLNVEVNCKDPTGITVPYRILVPRLQCQYSTAENELQQPASKEIEQPSGFKRLLSFRKKPEKPKAQMHMDRGEEGYYDEDYHSDASSDLPPRP